MGVVLAASELQGKNHIKSSQWGSARFLPPDAAAGWLLGWGWLGPVSLCWPRVISRRSQVRLVRRGGLAAASLTEPLALHRLGPSHVFGVLVGFERHRLGVAHHDGGAAGLSAGLAAGHLADLVCAELCSGSGPRVRPDLAAGLGQQLQRRLVGQAILLNTRINNESIRIMLPVHLFPKLLINYN